MKETEEDGFVDGMTGFENDDGQESEKSQDEEFGTATEFDFSQMDADEETEEDEDEETESEGETPENPVPMTPKAPNFKKMDAKKVRIKKTAKNKFVDKMMKKAGIDKLPSLDQLMEGKIGTKMKIKDIGIFIGTPTEEIVDEIAKACPVKNIVNLSTEVSLDRAGMIGVQVFRAGKMFLPIIGARITDSDCGFQCTSGRNRLLFLAIVYGTEVEIPVYCETMKLNSARDAVVVANQARPTRALEKAEHSVLGAVGGNADARQTDIYSKMVISKSRALHYCIYSVVERGSPVRLAFPISIEKASRSGGKMTTLMAVKGFWKNALTWEDGMASTVFDENLKNSVIFLNTVVARMREIEGFKPEQHLATMTLTGIGKFYRTCKVMNLDIQNLEAKIAAAIVAMGDIARQKSEKTFAALGTVVK